MFDAAIEVLRDGGSMCRKECSAAIRSRLTECDTPKAEVERLKEQLQYPDPEDMPGELAAKYCPFKDPLHFHHDGCPSEWAVETRAKKAEAELAAARPLLEAAIAPLVPASVVIWADKIDRTAADFKHPIATILRQVLVYREAREGRKP